jgi:hypothetical protein
MSRLSEEFAATLTRSASAALAGFSRPALLLSGGLDSGVTLAAMKAAGLRADIYTVTFGEYDTADAKLAQLRARHLVPDWRFETIRVPRDIANAEATMRWCLATGEAVLKTGIEVLVMLKPALERVAALGHDAVVHGMNGGTLWGISKEYSMALRRDPAEWQQMRVDQNRMRWRCYPPDGAMLGMIRCRELGIGWLDPLADCADWMLARPYAELNRPHHKGLTVRAFPELGSVPPYTGGMQVIGGAREFMQVCAEERGFDSAMLWYGAVAREMGLSPRGDGATRDRFLKGEF